MAEKLTEEEKDDIKAFVLYLFEISGKTKFAEYARFAGVGEFGFADWRKGRGAPNAVNLMRMMRASGLLDADFRPVSGELAGPGEAEHPPAPEGQPVRLEDLVGATEHLADEVSKMLPLLRESLAARRPASGDGLPETATK